jgi:hypothetical protein
MKFAWGSGTGTHDSTIRKARRKQKRRGKGGQVHRWIARYRLLLGLTVTVVPPAPKVDSVMHKRSSHPKPLTAGAEKVNQY